MNVVTCCSLQADSKVKFAAWPMSWQGRLTLTDFHLRDPSELSNMTLPLTIALQRPAIIIVVITTVMDLVVHEVYNVTDSLGWI